MCMGCWKEHGSPTALPADGEALAKEAWNINPFGAFHIVIEDFNIEDHHLDFCLNLKGEDAAQDHEVVWGRRMRELTVKQRAAVLGKAEEYF